MSSLEDTFYKIFKTYAPSIKVEREYPFADLISHVPEWKPEHRVDFYLPDYSVVFEINGGTGKGRGGAHSSFAGIKRDYLKQLYLTLEGIAFIELDTQMAKDEILIKAIVDFITGKCDTMLSATQIPSLNGAKKKQRNEELTYKALEQYTKRKRSLPNLREILRMLKQIKKSARMQYIKPWLLEHGWKQTKVGWSK